MATVKFLLNRPKSKKPTSIMVRFNSPQTSTIFVSTGEMILPEHWDGSRVTSKYRKQHDRINKHLSSIESQLLDLWRDNKGASGEDLTLMVRRIVKGEATVEKKTFIEAVRLFIAQYEREKEPATVGRYRVLERKLNAFNPNLTFDEINQTFYDEFKKWLYGNHNPVYAGYDLRFDPDSECYTLFASDKPKSNVGLFDDIVFKYLVNVQTILTWASKRGYQVNPAYKDWEIIKREYPVISLTLDELQRIESLDNLGAHLKVAQDYFSICCRTGQRISDVKRISTLAISTGSWTIHQKKGSRQKQKVVSLPLVGFCEPVKGIIAKYGGQLPEISEQKLNTHIKTLCKMAGITQEIFIERWQGNKKIKIPGKKYEFISLHSGKRTFITILGNMAVPIKVISDFTGTSIKTIEKHYLGRTELYVAESYLKKIESPDQLKKVI